jgi:hypothetical protein
MDVKATTGVEADEPAMCKLRVFLDDVTELNVVPQVDFGSVQAGIVSQRMIMVTSRDGRPFRLSVEPALAQQASDSTCRVLCDATEERPSHMVSLLFFSRAAGSRSGEILLLPSGSYRPASLKYRASVTP